MARNIATRISLGALTLTMAVALILGVASYLFSRHTLKTQIQDGLAFKTSIVGNRLEAALNNINNDMHIMSGNLIVTNALLDSAGREAYVEPFLRSFQLPHQIPFILTLSDFAGKPILSSKGPKNLRYFNDEILLAQVIASQQSLARIETAGDETTLLIAYPVLYTATGMAEGMLVIEVPLIPFITDFLADIIRNEGILCTLSSDTKEMWTTLKDRATPLSSTTTTLTLPPPLAQLALNLTVSQSTAQVHSSLFILAVIYLVIGACVLLLVVIQSRLMGRRLAAPLIALTQTANQIVLAGVAGSHAPNTGGDEISQLTTSFNTMLKHLQEAQANLEVRVEERTAELAQTMMILDTILENSPIGIAKVVDRKLVWLNRRAKDIFQYTKEEVVFQTTRILFPSDEAFENFGRVAYPLLSKGLVFETDQDSVRKDGTHLLIRYIGKALVPQDLGQGIIWLLEDITERKLAEQALKISEEKFRTIANHTYAWEIWESPAGDYLYCSPSCERLTGYTDKVFMNESCFLERLIHPEDLGHWLAHHAEVHGTSEEHISLAEVVVDEFDFRILHADGDVRWISHTCYPIHDEEGCSLGRRISNRDITDRKKIEDALHRSEETLRRAQAVSEIGSWQLDIPTNHVTWSEETYRLFGVPPEQGVNIKTLMAIIHPDDRKMFLAAWNAALDGAFYDITHRIVVGGNIVWVRERAEIERDADGKPLLGIGTVQNVTERKHSHDQIVKLAQELQTILATLTVGVTFVKNRRVQWANTAHEILYGYSFGQTVGQDTSIFYADENGYKRVGAGYAELARGVAFNTEVEMIRKDGRPFWCSLSGRAVNPEQPDAGSIWVFQDVSERRAAEDKLHAYAEMQAVLLREVNHRVKNNLVAIISMLHQEEDLAQEKGITEEQCRIQEVVGRVSGLLTVHRLLSSSEWKPLPLSRLCATVIQETIKGLGIGRTIHMNIAPSSIQVDSDQAHSLAMVLNELSTNVLKYAIPEGAAANITVSFQQREGIIELFFQDDGPGFPETLLQNHQVAAKSSSIGMSLMKGLVTRNLRGTLTLQNNNGAMARITFPAMMIVEKNLFEGEIK